MKRLIPILLFTAILLALVPVTAQQTSTYYTLRAARVRSCASTFCDRLGSIPGNSELRVVSSVQGQKWSGSTTWHQIDFDGVTGYVHSSLLTTLEPGRLITPGAPTYVAPPLQSYLINPPIVLTSPPSRYTCNGIDDLNCSDFANQREANAHLQQCPFDEDFLDADNNGSACEALPP
jgi:hypothetical protein